MRLRQQIKKLLRESTDILNDNFRKWFSGSKIVTSSGKPLEVYHGSYSKFEKFNNFPTYFTADWYNADGYAGGENVYEVYLSIKRPLIVDGNAKKWDELDTPYGKSTQEIVGNVDTTKYDGVIIKNVKDSWIDDVDYQDADTIYVTFSSNQIKSINNDGSWDINDDNIYS